MTRVGTAQTVLLRSWVPCLQLHDMQMHHAPRARSNVCQTLELTCWPTGVAAPFASDVTFFHVCVGLVVERAGVSACAGVAAMQATSAISCPHHAIVASRRIALSKGKNMEKGCKIGQCVRLPQSTLHRWHRRRLGGVKRAYQARNASLWLTSESEVSPGRPAQHL